MTELERMLNEISSAGSNIGKAESAKAWLEQHGKGCELTTHCLTASGCSGYKDAMYFMTLFIRRNMEKLVEEVVEDCEEAISANRATIKRLSEKL